MNRIWNRYGVAVLLLALVMGSLAIMSQRQPAFGRAEAADKAPVSGPHYTVVATDGGHLIVTDNGTNKVYFYAIDKDGKIGDELKLRGSVDLSGVGSPSLKPIDAKPQK